MRRTKWPLPPHELKLEDLPPLLVSVELFVNGRREAVTTFDKGTTLESQEVKDFVLQHFHIPISNRKPRKSRAFI